MISIDTIQLKEITPRAIVFFTAMTGLIAAYYWHRASRVTIPPPYKGFDPSDSDHALANMQEVSDVLTHVLSVDKAFRASSRLNETAAFWTTLSVVLSAVHSLM